MSDRKPRIAIVDTYYPDFLASHDFDMKSAYDAELDRLLARSFGTADFYGRALRGHGWETIDIIANCPQLLALSGFPSLERQLWSFRPDVVFMQDLSVKLACGPALLAGQCSCPLPSRENIARFDVLFSSFPHYVDRFNKMGTRAVYNSLAFDPIMLQRSPAGAHEYDCSFVGGVGAPSHWRAGMETLEAVARHIPTSFFWGYGYDKLPYFESAVAKRYMGKAWGTQMYDIFSRSKIVVNRHGEVAEGCANNMRMFEATGMGAMLLTDAKDNLFADDEAVKYDSPSDAVGKIRYYIAHPVECHEIAVRGSVRTLRDHTYDARMKVVSDVLLGMI